MRENQLSTARSEFFSREAKNLDFIWSFPVFKCWELSSLKKKQKKYHVAQSNVFVRQMHLLGHHFAPLNSFIKKFLSSWQQITRGMHVSSLPLCPGYIQELELSAFWESGDLTYTSLKFQRNYATGVARDTGRNPNSRSFLHVRPPLGQWCTWVATIVKAEITRLWYPDPNLRAAQHRHHLHE